MDPFTQKLLERTNKRREVLNAKLGVDKPLLTASSSTATVNKSPLKTSVSQTAVPEKRRSAGKTSSSSLPNKSSSSLKTDTEKENTIGFDDREKHIEDVHAPPKKSRGFESSETSETDLLSSAPVPRRQRFAALANRIQEWDDEPLPTHSAPVATIAPQAPKAARFGSPTKNSTSPTKNTATPTKSHYAPQPNAFLPKFPTSSPVPSPQKQRATSPPSKANLSPIKKSLTQVRDAVDAQNDAALAQVDFSYRKNGASKEDNGEQDKVDKNTPKGPVRTPTKSLAWDRTVLASLEAQGYTPSSSRSRLIYEFEKERRQKQEEEEHKPALLSPIQLGQNDYSSEDEEDEEQSFGQTEDVEEEGANSWAYKAPSPSKTPVSVVKPAQSVNKPLSPSKTPVSAVKPTEPIKKSPSKPTLANTNTPSVSVAQRAALFEKTTPQVPLKDPAELTMSERKALFEKNKAAKPLTVKAAFGMAVPAKNLGSTSPVKNAPKPVEALRKQKSPAQPVAMASLAGPSVVEAQRRIWEGQTTSQASAAAAAQIERKKELESLRNRWGKGQTPSKADTEQEQESESEEEEEPPTPKKETVSNRRQQTALSAPPMPPPMPQHAKEVTKSISPAKTAKQYPGSADIKPICVSPPKPGRVYPCLSDIDVNSTETEPEETEEEEVENEDTSAMDQSMTDMDSSFTVDILGKAGLSSYIKTPNNKRPAESVSASNSSRSPSKSKLPQTYDEDDSQEQENISDLLDEALDDAGPTPPKHSRLPQYVVDEDLQEDIPLFHSVSFYRKQKPADLPVTPVRQIIRRPDVNPEFDTAGPSTSDRDPDGNPSSPFVPVHHQIRALQDEINAQQVVISQASQALNLCRATQEFSGSTEQVEGERLLLVATQKRQAAMNEIQRLKTEAAMGIDSAKQALSASRGTLSLSGLALPLKPEFLKMMSRGGDGFIHYFLILVRCGAQVVPTQMLDTVESIQDGCLQFPNLIQLRDLRTDFHVAIEVYALQTKQESLPHEAKYHIRKESSRMRLTPKKLLSKQDSSRLSVPVRESPGGPMAVRTSSFGLVGYTTLSTESLRRKHWALERVPLASPLTGALQLKIQCHAESQLEERGFLTVFEDVSGFGAWHRRWAVLQGDVLAFWKYPDDERKKDPLCRINLRTCVTPQVGLVSRDVCARPNTVLLVTVRPAQKSDKDSLVMTCYSHRTAIRHLLSADSKEERHLWTNQLNKALANLRAWNPDAEVPTAEGV